MKSHILIQLSEIKLFSNIVKPSKKFSRFSSCLQFYSYAQLSKWIFFDSKQTHLMNNFCYLKTMWSLFISTFYIAAYAQYCEQIELINDQNRENHVYKIRDGDQFNIWTKYVPYQFLEKALNFTYVDLLNISNQTDIFIFQVMLNKGEMDLSIIGQSILLTITPDIKKYEGTWIENKIILQNMQLNLKIVMNKNTVYEKYIQFTFDKFVISAKNNQDNFPGFISQLYRNEDRCPKKDQHYFQQIYYDPFIISQNYAIGMWFRIQYQNFEDDKIIIMNCVNRQNRDLFTIFMKYDFLNPFNSTLHLQIYNQYSLDINDPYKYLLYQFDIDDFQGDIQEWSYISLYYYNKNMQFYIYLKEQSKHEEIIYDLDDDVSQFSYQEVIPQENSNSQSVEIYAASLRGNIDYEFGDFDYIICHHTCSTCFGPLSNNCLSCQAIFNREYYQQHKTCKCKSGYFDFQDTYICESNLYSQSLDITAILPNIEKMETMNAAIGCEPGYYEISQSCFEWQMIQNYISPQIQDSQNILCGDCFDNAIQFQTNYICTYDYFRENFKEGYQKLQRREQDYIQYAFDVEKFQLVLCDGCRKFCTDLTQQGCYISKYMFNNQFASILYLRTDTVRRCADNCDICDQNTLNCKQCRFNHALFQNKCVKCQENCLECQYDSQNNLKCLNCKKSYYYDGIQCKQCGTNCQYCEFENGQSSCKHCFDNDDYFISGQDCLTKTIKNCQYQYEYQNNIYCALCDKQYVNYLTYCQYDVNLMDDEQVVVKNNRTINILKRYESNNLLKNKCFIKFCEFCIENYNNNHQFCVKCQIGYYSNILNGQCKQCPKDCYSCIQSNANYNDDWKWGIIPFKHFILGIHKDEKANDYFILCLSCFDDYELYNGYCIKPCHPSCKECQKQDNQNICIRCYDSPLGQQLSIFNNECIECPLYCNFCLPRRSTTQIPEEQFVKYQYKCLKAFPVVRNLFYNRDFQQYVHCDRRIGCMKQIKITINCFCDYKDYQSFGQSSDFYINDLFSKDPNSHFRKIESDQIINYFNEEQVDHIYYNIELISDQYNYCQIQPNTFISSRLKKNVFTLQMVSVYFYSKSEICLNIQDEFVFNGFDSVKIDNIYFQVVNANLKVVDCKYLYIYNSLFQGYNLNNYIKFQIDKVQFFEMINVAFNKTIFNNLQVIQFKQSEITITIKNFSLNDCQFYNSTLLYSLQTHIYLDIEIVNIFVNSQFHQSKLIYFQKGYNKNLSIISITNSYHYIQSVKSQLYDIQNIKDIDIKNVLITNSTLEDSTILMAQQYSITFILINNNIFINSSLIKNNDQQNKLSKLYIAELQIINNTYSQFTKFIHIINPQARLTIQDSVIKLNVLNYTSILQNNALFEFSIYSLQLKNIIYMKQDGLPDFLLLGLSNITLQQITITQTQEKIKFLHQEKQCFISQLNNQNYGYFISIQDLVYLQLDQIQITGIQTINDGIINIISVQKIEKIQINIINSKFFDNQIAITNKQQSGAIIVIHSELKGNIFIQNVIFIQNLLIDYSTDNNFQVATLLSLNVPFQQVQISNCQFDRNYLFNSISSIIIINSQSILIQHSNFTNSNLYDYKLIKDSMIFGFFKDTIIYHEQVQNVIQNKNYGGSANLKASQIIVQNCEIRNSFGVVGGAFYLTVGSWLQVNQCTFNNIQANLQSSSSQGGALYITDSDKNLEINISDTRFVNCYSHQSGGAIMLSSKLSQFIKIKLFNIQGREIFSINGAFLYIQTTNNINLILNVERFTYENSQEGSFKLLSQVDTIKSHQLGFLFDIQQGQLNFKQIEIVSLFEYGLVICKNTWTANFNLILASIMTNKFLELNRGQLTKDFSFKQIKVTKLQWLGQQLVCQPNQELILQQNDMKCMNFEPLLDLEMFFNDTYLLNKAICNLRKNQDLHETKSLIYVNNQNQQAQFIMKDVQISGIQCQNCNFGIIFIGNIPNDFRKQILLSKIYLVKNICGYSGCMNIIGFEQFSNLGIDQKQKYPTLVLEDSQFISNIADRGGGLYLSDIDVLIRRTLFMKNQAVQGGAIYQVGENSLQMQFSKFSNNIAIEGQSIYLHDQQLDLSKQRQIEIDGRKNDQLISELPTKLTLKYKNVELNKTIILQNSTLYREQIELDNGRFIYLPTGYHLNSYKIFNETTQNFINKNITLTLVALNEFNQKQISLNQTKCFISSVNDNLQYFSKQEIEYNYNQQGYVLDDLIIRYDPYNIDYLQIKINCDSIRRQNNQKYELLFNVKTYYCQRGEYYNKSEVTCNLCDQNQQFYTVIAGGICKQINRQYMDEITSARIKLKQGYWRPNEINDHIEFCLRNSQNCIGGWNTGNQLCQIGNIGALCEQCDIYNIMGNGRFAFKDYHQCANCGEETINYIIIIIIILGTLLSIFLSVKGTVQNIEWTTKIIKLKQIGLRIQLNKENNSSVLIKLFINYIIILSSITTFQIELPQFINSLIITTSNPIQSISYSVDCLLIKFEYIDILYLRQIYSILIPLIYSTMFLICFNILLILKKSRYTFSIISTSVLYIYSYMQPNLIGGLISILAYRVISNIYWIQGNVSYQYFTQQHKQWLFYFIIPFLLIISILIPFSIVILLYKKQKLLNKPKFRMIWGYLYIEYIDSAYYWEIIKLQQKQIIICILTFYEDLIILKSILIFLTIVLYDIISKVKQPFKKRKQNQLDQKVSQILAGSIVFAQIIYISQQYSIQQYQYPFYTLLFLINAYFIIILLSKIIVLFFSYFQNSIEILKEYLINKLPIHKLGYTINLLFVLKKDKKRRISTRINVIRQNLFPQAKKIAMFRRQTTTMITQETLMTENTSNKSNNDIIKLISQKNTNLEQQHKLQNYPQLNQMIKLITGNISRKE
ncbi:hypothetical protein pb186bvf_010954 [Paramecium bursaria]